MSVKFSGKQIIAMMEMWRAAGFSDDQIREKMGEFQAMLPRPKQADSGTPALPGKTVLDTHVEILTELIGKADEEDVSRNICEMLDKGFPASAKAPSFWSGIDAPGAQAAWELGFKASVKINRNLDKKGNNLDTFTILVEFSPADPDYKKKWLEKLEAKKEAKKSKKDEPTEEKELTVSPPESLAANK